MKKILIFLLLFIPALVFSQEVDSVKLKTFSSLTAQLWNELDTADQVGIYDSQTGTFLWRGSLGQILRAINLIPDVIGSANIIGGSIVNEDISGSASITLNKLENLSAGSFIGRDATGVGIPEELTGGYGFTFGTDRVDADTSSATGLVSKQRLTNALDDISGGGGGGSGNVTGRGLQSLTADGTDTLNFSQKSVDYWQIDLSSVTSSTINFSNPNDTVVPQYALHFTNVSTDTLDFTAQTFLDANKDTIKTYVIEQGQIIPIYYDKATSNYFTNYIELSVTDDQTAIEVAYTKNGQTTVDGALDSLFNQSSGTSITEGTPTSPSSPTADAGSMLYDNSYFYVKTGLGWSRIAVELVPSPANDTVNLYNPIAYWHADSIPSTTDGGAISAWADLTSNNHDYSQGTGGNQPLFRSSGIGGKGAVDFDGTDDYMETSNFQYNNDSVTIVAVVRYEAISAANQTIFSKVNTTDQFFFGNNPDSLLRPVVRGTGASGFLSDTLAAANGNYIVVASIDAVNDLANIYVNGALKSSIDGSSSTNVTIGDANSTYGIGAKVDSSISEYFNGRVAVIAVYNKVLTTTEMLNVSNYLNTQYGVY